MKYYKLTPRGSHKCWTYGYICSYLAVDEDLKSRVIDIYTDFTSKFNRGLERLGSRRYKVEFLPNFQHKFETLWILYG